MPGKIKPRSEQDKIKQKKRTARNQVKRYEKVLKTAGGKCREDILKKLEYYKQIV